MLDLFTLVTVCLVDSSKGQDYKDHAPAVLKYISTLFDLFTFCAHRLKRLATLHLQLQVRIC